MAQDMGDMEVTGGMEVTGEAITEMMAMLEMAVGEETEGSAVAEEVVVSQVGIVVVAVEEAEAVVEGIEK